jgi:hypothetical protein
MMLNKSNWLLATGYREYPLFWKYLSKIDIYQPLKVKQASRQP